MALQHAESLSAAPFATHRYIRRPAPQRGMMYLSADLISGPLVQRMLQRSHTLALLKWRG
jgi:hypothetical protein